MSYVLILLTIIHASLKAIEFTTPETFASAPKEIFVPQGFDNNDNIEIFFEGNFTDACHKVGMTSHSVDFEQRHIYITDLGYYFGQDFCAHMITPYQKGVNTGILPKGNWQVFFRHSRGNFVEEGIVPIKASTSNHPDDYLYAPVEKIKYLNAKGEKPARVVLWGQFFNTCMEIDQIKINQKDSSNVIEVLPIARMKTDGCEDTPEGIDFKKVVELQPINPGRFLIHTRANNGRSVNEIVTIH